MQPASWCGHTCIFTAEKTQQACTWLIRCNQDIFWVQNQEWPQMQSGHFLGSKPKVTPETRFYLTCSSASIFLGLQAFPMLGARPLQAVLVLNGSDLSFSVSTQFSLVGRGRQVFLTMLVGGAAATPCPQDTEKAMTLPSPRATLPMLHRETVDHSAQLRTSSLFRSGFYENTLASHEKTKKLKRSISYQWSQKMKDCSIYNAHHSHF